MFEKSFTSLSLWQFDLLSKYPQVTHFVSGRNGGISEGEIGSFNLSYRTGDTVENVKENRRRLANSMEVAPERLYFPAQTHSMNVQHVTQLTKDEDINDTDALVTNEKDICICVMSADCVPILLFDPVTNSIGAVHSGWKGTVGKILTNTIKAMEKNFGSNPKNLIAAIGPSICQEVYEVGEEVISAVENAFGSKEGLIIHKEKKDKGHFDLWEANKRQLLELGVPEASIEVAGICTYQNSEDFFSARKSQNKGGRFAAGIKLKAV